MSEVGFHQTADGHTACDECWEVLEPRDDAEEEHREWHRTSYLVVEETDEPPMWCESCNFNEVQVYKMTMISPVRVGRFGALLQCARCGAESYPVCDPPPDDEGQP